MKHQLPELPYSIDALEPWISKETLSYHYGKHHQGYLDKLNELLPGSKFEHSPLEQIVHDAEGVIYENAAQAWNHNFFWHCLSTTPSEPSGVLRAAIERDFGSYAEFTTSFKEIATDFFGSGWIWLSEGGGKLRLEAVPNAGTPLRSGRNPLLTCDLWEHAYYIDYRNERAKFLDAFFRLANWNFALENFSAAAWAA